MTSHATLPAELPALTKAPVSYIDSIQVQQNSYFKRSFLTYVNAHCRSLYGPTTYATHGDRCIVKLFLHQPDQDVLHFLSGEACSIFEAHIALDLPTQTTTEAEQFKDFLTASFLPARRPTDLVHNVESTTYFAFNRPRGRGMRAALYADMPSKVLSGACCHLELRFSGSAALKKEALRQTEELIALDHQDLWSRHLKLVEPPSAIELGLAWERGFMASRSHGRMTFPHGTRRSSRDHIGHEILDKSRNGQGTLICNDLLYRLQNERPLGRIPVAPMFRRINTKGLLPGPGNGLWG